MWDIYHVTVPNDYIIEFYVNEAGYFQWADTTRFYITSEHIWRYISNVSAFILTDNQIIGTGPFKWNEYIPGESISLLRQEDWCWDIRDVSIPPSSSSSSSEEGLISRTTKITAFQNSVTENTSGFTLVILLSVLIIKRLKRKRNS
jgi:ABC-type transport system substrate-binding protein